MAGTRDSTPFCKVFLGFCCAALIAGFCCIIAPILLAFVAVPKYHNYIHEETHHVTTTCTFSNETLKGKVSSKDCSQTEVECIGSKVSVSVHSMALLQVHSTSVWGWPRWVG